MKRLQAFACALFAFGSCASHAASPLLNARESVTIHASPDAVWVRVKDFDGIASWHPGVSSDELVLGTNYTVGAERLLTLPDGGTVKEKLLAYEAKHRRYSYTILQGSLPIIEYTAMLNVKAAGPNRAKVTWSAIFKRKHAAPGQATAMDDAALTKATNHFFRNGLDHLKEVVEKK